MDENRLDVAEAVKKPKLGVKGIIAQLREGLSGPVPEDMDKKEVSKQVLAIAWPAMLENFLLSLASMVNTMMVGGLGTWAIASIGYVTQPRFLLLAVFQALNVGATALIARAKGSGDAEEANRIMHQSLTLSILVSLVMVVIGYIFAEPLIIFMGAETEQTIVAGTLYFRIILLSFPANVVSLSITAILRGIGKTRISMIYNVTANAVNISVGFLFISGRFGLPALGVGGAGLGMAAGQVVAMIIALVTLFSGAEMLKLRLKSLFHLDIAILKRISNVGTPAMFEQLCMRTGQLIFSKIVASLGTDAYATHQIANNILSMSMMNGMAFGISATSLLGQAMGRERPDQGKAAVQVCRRYGMILSLVMAAVMVFGGRWLVGMYTTEMAVIETGAVLLIIVAVVQPLQSSQQVLAGALRGAGDTKAVALCIFIGIVIVRPVFAFLFTSGFDWGLVGIWLSLVIDQCTRSFYTMWRFSTGKWKAIKV